MWWNFDGIILSFVRQNAIVKHKSDEYERLQNTLGSLSAELWMKYP